MEASSLIKAHDHARAASTATHSQTADPTVASNEHALAAGEFANAAKTTSSVEALRTLKLLEQHHERLSWLLKLPPSSQSSVTDEGEKSTQPGAGDGSATDTQGKSDAGAGSTAKTPATLPHLAQPRRYPARDLTSSIASNLASARGIRSKYRGQPLTPSVSNAEAPGNVEVRPRREGSRAGISQAGQPAWVPPSHPAREDSKTRDTVTREATPAPQASAEDGYSRFYNTFGSLINRLSAPLAFAGLPLIAEESSNLSETAAEPESSSAKRNRLRGGHTVSVEPDWSRSYSRATRQALDKQGHTTNDSFYVVPPSGHTVSYANILSFAEKEKRRLEQSTHLPPHGDGFGGVDDEDDDFVDARETPLPLSPGAKRKIGRARTEKDYTNTIEELYLENKSLKDMLDKLSKRLHAFEASAQNSSLALAESMRLMRPGSPLSNGAGSGSGGMPPPVSAAGGSSGGGSGASDELKTLRKENQELKENLALATTQMEGMDRERRKLEKIVNKYRDKWEKLKAGAKARREAQGGAVDVFDEEAGPS